MKKYKVGFLLDSFLIRRWQYEILDFLVKHPAFEIELVVINDAKRFEKKNSRYWIYKLFMRLDKKIFRAKIDLFELRNVEELLKTNKVLRVNPKQNKSTDEIIESDLALIRQCNLDLIIRFGFRILKGDILSVPRYGIWSLHHGDNRVNRGGPPGFWEVANYEIVTGVTMLKLSEELDGGTVLGKSFTKTDNTSFHRNLISLFAAGVELFCASLNTLAKEGAEHFFRETEKESFVGFYSHRLYRNPTNSNALKIFIFFWVRRIKELLRDTFFDQQWSLYYNYSGSSTLQSSLIRYRNLRPPRGSDWADPFVIHHGDSIYVFFEEFIRKKKKAHISVFEFNQKGQLVSPTPTRVLSEPYHLSYPFITEVDGVFYMIPESASAKKVSLYICEKYPLTWVKKEDFLDGIEFFDPTLYNHEGIWYLFGTIRPCEGSSPDQYLAIYYSDDLVNGTWKPHPLNPLARDVRGSRPAGRIFFYEEKIIRPTQIGAPKYGYSIRFYHITKLTPTEFSEKPLEDILPAWERGLLATHTFNFANGFSVIDAQRRRVKI